MFETVNEQIKRSKAMSQQLERELMFADPDTLGSDQDHKHDKRRDQLFLKININY